MCANSMRRWLATFMRTGPWVSAHGLLLTHYPLPRHRATLRPLRARTPPRPPSPSPYLTWWRRPPPTSPSSPAPPHARTRPPPLNPASATKSARGASKVPQPRRVEAPNATPSLRRNPSHTPELATRNPPPKPIFKPRARSTHPNLPNRLSTPTPTQPLRPLTLRLATRVPTLIRAVRDRELPLGSHRSPRPASVLQRPRTEPSSPLIRVRRRPPTSSRRLHSKTQSLRLLCTALAFMTLP